jgi:hypothetical protein
MYANRTKDGIIEIGYSAANEKAGDKFRKDRGFGMAKARAEKHGKQVRAKLAYYTQKAERDQEVREHQDEAAKTGVIKPKSSTRVQRVTDQVTLEAAGSTTEIIVGPGHKKQLDDFISRCHRYFKGDDVYVQTISQANVLKDGEACKITKIFGGECEIPELTEKVRELTKK